MGRREAGISFFTCLLGMAGIDVVVQLWLVSATLEAMMAHDRAVLIPAALASCGLAAINGALLLMLIRYERHAADSDQRR